MLLSVADTIQKFINSPPGQFTAGAVLAGLVWKFFERVETLLTADTKLRIAVYLLGVRSSEKLESLPSTSVPLFQRLFGKEHFTVSCFLRCALASIIITCLMCFVSWAAHNPTLAWPLIFVSVLTNILPDYLAYFLTRISLKLVARPNRLSFFIGILDLVVSLWLFILSFDFTVVFLKNYFDNTLNKLAYDLWEFAFLSPQTALFELLQDREFIFHSGPFYYLTVLGLPCISGFAAGISPVRCLLPMVHRNI